MKLDEELKSAVKQMSAEQYSELRDAYYKAAEGLAKLNSLLQAAGESEFSTERKQIHEAKRSFDRCSLGKIL